MSKLQSNEKTPSELHHGHRERLRQRFIRSNGRDLCDHELLELLLFYTHPRSDTNPLAHRLLDEFGSLKDVLSAPPERIHKVMGAGNSTALFFEVLFCTMRRIRMQKYFSKKQTFNTLSSVGEFLTEHYNGSTREELYAMFLDSSMRLIDFRFIASGGSSGLCFDIKSLAKAALDSNAEFVILSHNHPGGDTTPSPSDREKTVQVEAALSAIGIGLLEHIIVSDVLYSPTMHTRMRNTRGAINNQLMSYERMNKFYSE